MDQSKPFAAFLKRERNCTEELGSFKIIHTEEAFGDSDATADGNKITSEYKIVYNETRQTNRHKNPSGVWKYFALATKDTTGSPLTPDDPSDDRILCMLCYTKGRVHVYKSKTSSSNLWKHLNRKHNIKIPSEKMFTIVSADFGGFEFNPEGEELSREANSTDDQLSGLGIDENDEIVVKSDDYEEMDEFRGEQTIGTSQDTEALVKYESCSTEAVFKDIGMAIIEEVAKRPILYELRSSKSPTVKATKEIMWAEVCEALGEVIQIDRIQKIWKNIRDRYRKIRNAEKEGLAVNTPKYKYYDQLKFLDVTIPIDQTSDTSLDEPEDKKARLDDYSFLIEQTDAMLSTVDELDRNEQNYISEEIIQENNCTVSSSNPPINTTTIYPLEIAHKNIEDSFSQHSLLSLPPTNNVEQMDEFDLFGKLIAKKLRAAPKERVNLIEIKIMQAILENS